MSPPSRGVYPFDIGVAVLVLLGGGALFWNKKRKQKLAKEASANQPEEGTCPPRKEVDDGHSSEDEDSPIETLPRHAQPTTATSGNRSRQVQPPRTSSGVEPSDVSSSDGEALPRHHKPSRRPQQPKRSKPQQAQASRHDNKDKSSRRRRETGSESEDQGDDGFVTDSSREDVSRRGPYRTSDRL